jgi:hypothetical protein
LGKFNKLLDYCCLPGEAHGFQIDDSNPRTKEFHEDFKKAFDHYIHKKSLFILNNYIHPKSCVNIILNIFNGTSNIPVNQITIKASGQYVNNAWIVADKLREFATISNIQTS